MEYRGNTQNETFDPTFKRWILGLAGGLAILASYWHFQKEALIVYQNATIQGIYAKAHDRALKSKICANIKNAPDQLITVNRGDTLTKYAHRAGLNAGEVEVFKDECVRRTRAHKQKIGKHGKIYAGRTVTCPRYRSPIKL